MIRLELEQNSEVWFEYRKWRLGGSKIGTVKPLSRGKYKGLAEGAAGFWKLVAEKLSLSKDGEDERERGHRLEQLALDKTNAKYGRKFVKGAVWQSEENERSYISPDGEEPKNLKVAQETKAFDPDKHLRLMWEDHQAQKLEGYRPFDSIPEDNKSQAVKYFTVNPELKTLYWTIISDLVAYDELEHYVLVIERSTIEKEITEQKLIEKAALHRSQQIVRELVDVFVKGGK